jgi:c-di-GMP-binding flagellar brake protein YcgR
MGLFEDLKGQIRRVILGQGRSFSQKRRHSRILCAIPVVLVGDNTSTLRGRVLDLSLEGARVEVAGLGKAPLKVGQSLVMSLAKANLGEREGEAPVRVRWVRKSTQGWEVGLHLQEVQAQSWVPRLLSECGLSEEAFLTRRSQARKPLQQKGRVLLGGNHTVPVDLIDLSLGGASVVSAKALARFLPVRLDLELAGKPISFSAQVAYVRPHSEPRANADRLWLCGLRFEDLNQAQAYLLGRELVRSRP